MRARGPAEHDDLRRFTDLARTNLDIDTLLTRLPELGLNDCWIVSGGLVQSVWNALSGFAPAHGILDYDVIYFDPDTSWDAEDRVIQRARALFSDLGVPVEIRNQARVHLWFAEKFRRRVPALKSACSSLWRYPSRTTAIALTQQRGVPQIVAPFGVGHALNRVVQPNRRSAQPDAYREKARRWQAIWPTLEVVPW